MPNAVGDSGPSLLHFVDDLFESWNPQITALKHHHLVRSQVAIQVVFNEGPFNLLHPTKKGPIDEVLLLYGRGDVVKESAQQIRFHGF